MKKKSKANGRWRKKSKRSSKLGLLIKKVFDKKPSNLMGNWGGKPNLINENEFWKLNKMANKKLDDN